MTTESPEDVLEDDDPMAGALTLFVAFCVTVWVVATGAAAGGVLLAALIWVLGTVLRIAEEAWS